MAVTITIRRQGRFSVPNLSYTNQCGRQGQKEFSFFCRITVTKLDEYGFVCDNFQVIPALENKFGVGRWVASCEQLASAGVHLMHELCKGRATRIEFEVSPIAEAGVTVLWESPDKLPEFLPRRLDKASPQRRTSTAQTNTVVNQWERMTPREVLSQSPF